MWWGGRNDEPRGVFSLAKLVIAPPLDKEISSENTMNDLLMIADLRAPTGEAMPRVR